MNALIVATLIATLPSTKYQNAQTAFNWEPMPLPKLANELAAVLGEPVQVAKSLWPTTVMVYAPQATVAEVQQKIAQATNATWSKRGGVWYLEQTPAQIKADERTYQEERRKAIQLLLDHNKKQLKGLKPFDEAHARKLYEEMRDFAKIYGANDNERVSSRINELEQESPPSRLNRRFLLALDVDTLAAVKPGERRVFSTQPTPMQFPMPGEISKLIAQFVEEQNVWASVTGEQPVTNEKGDGLGLEFGANVEPITQPIGTVLVTVDGYQDDSFAFRLAVFDRMGKFVLETESSSWDTLDESDFPTADTSAPTSNEETLLPPESKALRDILSVTTRRTEKWKMVTDAMLATWRKPTLRDPLAYYVGNFLTQESKTRKKALVAVVPDGFMEQFEYGYLKEMLKLQTRTPSLSWLFDAKVVEEDKWLVVNPVNPLRVRNDYQDRGALEQELALGARLDPPSLEEEADLALKKGPNGEFGSFTPLTYSLRSNPFHSGNQAIHLRIFAAMTQPGRTAALQKGGVAIHRLPKIVQDEIHRLVYMGEPHALFMNEIDEAPGATESQEPDPKLEAFYNGIAREPTVILPKGIPGNTTISFEVETSYLVQTSPNPKGTFPRQGDLVGATDLAERSYMAANPTLFPWISDSTLSLNTSRMRLILSRTIKIVYNFQNGFRTVGSLQELRPIANKTFTLQSIPLEIKEEFVNAQKELESRMKNRKPGR